MLFKREIMIRLCDVESQLDYAFSEITKLEKKVKALEKGKTMAKKGK